MVRPVGRGRLQLLKCCFPSICWGNFGYCHQNFTKNLNCDILCQLYWPQLFCEINRHLKERPKIFWANIMEKTKILLLFLKNYQPTFHIGKQMWWKSESSEKKLIYPPKNTLYEGQKFLRRVSWNYQIWKNVFFYSKTLPQIDVFSSSNLEYTIKNDRPLRS